MKSGWCLLVVALIAWVGLCVGQTPREKAERLVANLTLAQKIGFVHGYNGPYVGNVPGISSLNIPSINLQDGPQGVARVTQVTCWPASTTVGMTWDTDLVLQWGTAMGLEQRLKGSNVHLGPDVNIARVPNGGRVFEMLGGEDPYLASRLVIPYVNGIQSNGVIANAKHFINNDQETWRDSISVNIDDRTLWEIYYQPFQAAVQEANVGSVMCSYNKINSTYACENSKTLSDLKKKMGFGGFVVSDWGATHSTVLSANAGLDMEQPDANFFGNALLNAVNAKQVSEATVNEMVIRIFTPMYSLGIFDRPQTGDLNANTLSDAHNSLARKLAVAGTVLLKNSNNVLPIKAKATIAVIGDPAINPQFAGGGSGNVIPPYVVPPLQGIQNRAGSAYTVKFAGSGNVGDAANLAKQSDIAIVFAYTLSSEGGDRGNLQLNPGEQDNLIATVAAAQPNTVVVLNTAGAVLMPWANAVRGILYGSFSGQEQGNSIADILFGDYNPSGRLSLSFPVNEKDWFDGVSTTYPGTGNNGQEQYTEKLLVGYRWYEAKNIKPLFPFGHGLSYTTFDYSNLKISGSISSGVTVAVDVRNSGQHNGAEVVQLYLSFPDSAGEPPKILRGFRKVNIDVNQSVNVQFKLSSRDVSIWDNVADNWKVVSGTFKVSIGASSADIKVTGTFQN